MFAARGNVWALDRARRVGRHVSVLALCAVGIGVGLATPAQADKIRDTKAEANRVWEQIQSDGERLEATIERYNGARFRLQQTMGRIHENEVRLATARAYQNAWVSSGRSRSYATSPLRTMRTTSGSTVHGNSVRSA